MFSRRPSGREDFSVAVICALNIEFEAVCFVIEEFWDENGDPFGKVAGDMNSYRTGRIGKHNVVLLLLPGMGKVHAAHAAANLYSSFTRLRLVLLVGGCAAVPRINNAEILLGDVIISTEVIQYDFGRQYPSGFMRKSTARDNLGKPQKEIRNLLAALQVTEAKKRLLKRTAELLINIQTTSVKNGYGFKYHYPGVREDNLYEASYLHKHRVAGCATCNETEDAVCDSALQATCEDLGCERIHLVNRKRIEKKLQLCKNSDFSHQNPDIFFGAIGSGDMVMKSGEGRDALAEREKVIALEMEAAGVWDEVPSLVVKGVFDYGDSHKNKQWQPFASATAACVARAAVEQFAWTDRGGLQIKPHVIEENWAVWGARQYNIIKNATQYTSAFIRGNVAAGQSEQSNTIFFSPW
ncbi:PNP_UDP_1 domain-containing protein [Trichoderma simmonsii]|uniref:PNP_UDP_1 domain-containing protein n=1 Tax=Trichoderma simmonsii TaxID=1491479 RepID=A0A8G0PGW8_9HYPO|nr:PNP_UDP_1 domain-containing protein [Trichoderma simmonsii]